MLLVPSTVMLELEFNALLETPELEFDGEAVLERALDQYRMSAAEFQFAAVAFPFGRYQYGPAGESLNSDLATRL